MSDTKQTEDAEKWGANEDQYRDLSDASRAVVHSFYLEGMTLDPATVDRLRRIDRGELTCDAAIAEVLEAIKDGRYV